MRVQPVSPIAMASNAPVLAANGTEILGHVLLGTAIVAQ
jgi:hypothetical protein